MINEYVDENMVKWKKLEGFKYYISENGDIRNLKFPNLIKQRINKSGKYVFLYDKNTKVYSGSVDKLVYKTFTGAEEEELKFIKHKNRDQLDCRLENLYIEKNEKNCKWCYVDGFKISDTGVVIGARGREIKSKTYNGLHYITDKYGKYRSVERIMLLEFTDQKEKNYVRYKDKSKPLTVDNLYFTDVRSDQKSVRNIDTGKVYISLQQARDENYLSCSSPIIRAIRTGGKCVGCHWEYVKN